METTPDNETTKTKKEIKVDVSTMVKLIMVRKCVPILLLSTVSQFCNELKKKRNMLLIIEIFVVLFNFDLFLRKERDSNLSW